MMRNNANYKMAVSEATKAVRDAEKVFEMAEKQSEVLFEAIEAKIFMGAEELKDTTEGEQILHNVLFMLDCWAIDSSIVAQAEEDLSEKKATLRMLLSL